MVSSPYELLGTSIGGFHLDKLIGIGGTGAVFLSSNDESQMAIKVLMPPWLVNKEAVEEFHKRFQREVRILSHLNHPHILPVHAFGDDAVSAFPYMIMPYKNGGTLSEQIGAGPLSLEKVLSYVWQLAQALDYAHAQNVIHRDIKPANVLLDEEDQVFLADFSIAKLYDLTTTTLTNTHHMLGTPAYMAPEQVANKSVSPATDVYGLGVLTYQLVTGRLPFDASALLALLHHIMYDPVPSPRTVRPDLSLSASDALLQALAKEPEARFASAGAFVQALEAGLQDSLLTLAGSRIKDDLNDDHARDDTDKTDKHRMVHSDRTPKLIAKHSMPLVADKPTRIHPETVMVADQQDAEVTSNQQVSIMQIGDQIQASSPDRPLTVDPTIYPTVSPFTDDRATVPQVSPSIPPLPQLSDALNQANKGGTKLIKMFLLLLIGKPMIRWQVVAVVTLAFLLVSGTTLYSYSQGSAFFASTNVVSSDKLHLSTENQGTLTSTSTLQSSATAAIVIVTPESKILEKAFTISAVTGVPDMNQHQVQARWLSAKTQPQSDIVNATGKGTIPGTYATGNLNIWNESTQSLTIPAGTVMGGQIVADEGVTIPPGPKNCPYIIGGQQVQCPLKTIRGHSFSIGTSGNIANGGDYYYYKPAGAGCVANNPDKGICYVVSNATTFTGGTDPQNYTFVQQSDINGAINTPNAQQVLQGQLNTNESWIGTPICRPQTTANHAANDKVTTVTVTATFTCTGEVYDQSRALEAAKQMLKNQAASDPGSGYTLVGDINATLQNAQLADANGTVGVTAGAKGTWVFQMNPVRRYHLASMLSGKKKAAAQDFLQQQKGIKQAEIRLTGGDQDTFPDNPQKITIQDAS